MRRIILVLLPILFLGACATPREACVGAAQRQLRVIDGLIAETQANLARGYALEERQEVRTIPRRCTGTTELGEEFRYRCPETITRTRTEPVAIDLNAERAKLNSLLERRAAQSRASEAAVRQCVATYPE